MSKISIVPSLVPTTAWRLPGANSAHRPYPLSTVRRQAPVRGFHTCRQQGGVGCRGARRWAAQGWAAGDTPKGK